MGLVAVAGCSGSGLVEVSGTATHDGQPVPNLFVKFEPQQGNPSWATTDAAGRFVLRSAGSEEGAVPGTHRVWVEYRPMEPDPNAEGPPTDPPGIETIEAKYGPDSSELTIEITGPQPDLQLKLD